MPNIKSQKKRMRLSAKRAERNKSAKAALRTAVKKADASIEANADDMDEKVKAAAIALESGVGKGVIHQNNASRQVSRLTRAANKAKADAS